MTKFVFIMAVSVCISTSYFAFAAEAPMKTQSLKEFQAEHEAGIKKNWLVVVGLDWLKEGTNSVGSAADSQVKLPAPVPAKFAVLHHTKNETKIEFLNPAGTTIDDKPVKAGQKVALSPDTSGKPTKVVFKNISFYLIDRPNGVGVRVKNSESDALKNFKGLAWFPETDKGKIKGRWVKLKEPRKMIMPDILGNKSEENVSGYLEFEYEGQKTQLYPSSEGEDGIFFVLRDGTSGKETYGAARFLVTDAPKADGTVDIDFNRATNPPCAYIQYATCPLPPTENYLKVAIRAGEMKPPGAKNH